MIIVRLMGGLGNQMFQYAAARALADRHGTCLKIDLSYFQAGHRGIAPREYALERFNIAATGATAAEIRRFTGRSGIPALDSLLRFGRKRGWLKNSRHLVSEDQPGLDFSRVPDDVYLDGYWQSESYFKGIEAALASELTVKEALTGADQALAGQMAATVSVSLHIRRGDYVNIPSINRIYGVCGLDYYSRAVAEVAARVERPHFFVFSDDCGWARENLKLDHPVTFVEHNGSEKSYRDLQLMSLCRHNIIANSSFSWWGAWLNRNAAKIVIAPIRWFSDERLDVRQIVPSRWILL